MPGGIIIVGGGHGAVQLCASLRQNGYSGPVTLVSSENLLPYHRPPLSKAFLKDSGIETQIIKPEKFYQDNNIQLMLGLFVTRIDCANNGVDLSDGSRLKYTKLVLATGALARKLEIAGADGQGVHYLKTASDAANLRGELDQAKSVCVIGGGFIGLEAAATFLALGKSVTVLEAGERLMGRAVAPEVSRWFLNTHKANGMLIKLNAAVENFELDNQRVSGVVNNNQCIPANIVLIGIGVHSNCELAEAAGIECDNGIVVDCHMQTSNHDVLAIGDCASFKHWQTKSMVRLESVQNANDQARNAALTLVGQSTPYREVAWFWSDQGKEKLQITGLSNGAAHRIVRSREGRSGLSVYHFDNNMELLAIDSINNPAEHMAGRKLLASGLSPELSDLRNPDFELRNMLAK